MECCCKARRVLTPAETLEIKKLLSLVGRKEIKVEKLAELELWDKSGKCEFLFSWGFVFYCANPAFINEVLRKK